MPDRSSDDGPLRITPRDRAQVDRWWNSAGPGETITHADVPDHIRHTWRWNDPAALRFDYQQAIAKRDSARRVKEIGAAAGYGGFAADVARRHGRRLIPPRVRRGLGLIPNPWIAGAGLAATILGEKDEVYFGRQAEALRLRLIELQRQ